MRATWQRANSLLCIRLDSVGDVLMTTPALRALKEFHPARRLTLLTSEAGARAGRLLPELDAVWTFRAPWMKPESGSAAADERLLERLRSAAFDGAVIFTVYSQSPLPAAYLCHLAGIPLRLAHCRENPYSLLTDWIAEPEPERRVRHEVRRQLDLVESIGCRPRHERLSLSVQPAARRRVERLLAAHGIHRGRPLLLAHPGATAASRRYPPESFAQALEAAAETTGCQIVLTGDASEGSLIDSVRTAMAVPSHSLAGELSLAQFAAAIALADVVVSNNTSAVHVAAAVGTPVVDLYALTNPQHTPWQVAHRVLYHDVPCRYCYKSVCPAGHHDCLRLVPPAAVAAAAAELITGAAQPSAPALPALHQHSRAPAVQETS